MVRFERWQEQVLSILRNEFCEELAQITTDEVDWGILESVVRAGQICPRRSQSRP
jgi:hypothetical protein